MTIHLKPAQAEITENDAFIAEALKSASFPTLMMSMIHMTGDTSWLQGAIKPNRATMGDVQGGLSHDQRVSIRAAALEALKAYRDRGCTLPPSPSAETVHAMMSFLVGEEVPQEYVPMMMEELALDGVDSRAFQWDKPVTDEQKRNFKVLVIGAGMSGLLAAIRLEEAGISYLVIEKNEDVGGTWFENQYPGCRVDSPTISIRSRLNPTTGRNSFPAAMSCTVTFRAAPTSSESARTSVLLQR